MDNKGKTATLRMEDERYKNVKLFPRSVPGMKHPKIKAYIVTVMDLQGHASDFAADAIFSKTIMAK